MSQRNYLIGVLNGFRAGRYGVDETIEAINSSPFARARRCGPDTSKDASKLRFAGRRKQVFEAVLLAGANGLTSFEASQRTGIPREAISGRLTELVRMGRVVDSGERRASDYGVKGIVFKVVPSAHTLDRIASTFTPDQE